MASAQVDDEAFVTLATNDTYSIGALVLAYSLRLTKTRRRLVVLISKDVSPDVRQQLTNVYDLVHEVNILDSRDRSNLALLTRPDLGVTFTKFHCWRLEQFRKCVFLDADTLVLQNIDELFDREELSAAPDAGWPDCFNSGVFVFQPSEETYQALLQCALTTGSFDGGDQGLLNLFFHDWATKDISKHLPFIYNVVSQAFYSYLPAFKQFCDKIKICHFIGPVKPWAHYFNTQTGQVEPQEGTGHNKDFLQIWWMIFMTNVQPNLDPSTLENVVQGSFTLKPPITHMVIPYQLPSVEIFYKSLSAGNVRIVKEVKIEFWKERRYVFYESHYSEVPLTQVDSDQPPSELYCMKEFDDHLLQEQQEQERKERERIELERAERERFERQVVVDKQTVFNDIHDTAVATDDVNRQRSNSLSSQSTSITASSVTSSVTTDTDTTISPCDMSKCDSRCQATVHGSDKCLLHGDNTAPSGVPCTCHPQPSDSTSEHGLIGQLASLRMDDSTTQQPAEVPFGNEREWQYAWERGQINYMGYDSFENIQRKKKKVPTATLR